MGSGFDLRHFQERLLERQQEITAFKQNQKEGRAPKQLDQARVGRLSRMDAMQQQAMSRANENLRDLELQRIKTALERIASEEYGYCVLCDEKIAVRRLNFDPSLLTCIECAQRAEAAQ